MSNSFPTFTAAGRVIVRAGRWGRRALPWLIGAFLVLAVVHGIATMVMGRRLEARIAEIEAKGEIVSLAKLGLPKVPDSRNAAVVYARVFPALQDEEAKSDLDVLDKLYVKGKPVDQAEVERAGRIARQYRWVIPIAEEAVTRPQCQFPVEWEKGFAARFPHLYPMRRLGSIVTANAVPAAQHADMDEAVRLLSLGLKMSDALADEPTGIGQHYRWAMIKSSTRGLKITAEYGRISESQARELADSLARIATTLGLGRAMEYSRAATLLLFDYARNSDARGLISSEHSSFMTRTLAGLMGSYAWRPFLYADELLYLDLMERQMEAVKLPYREIDAIKGEFDIDDRLPFYAMISKLTSYHPHSAGLRDETRADIDGSRIFLGLLAYRDKFGAYPQSLDQLRSKLNWDVPEDPFSGKDFIYRPEGKGFILYSLGRNLRDDNAKPRPEGLTGPDASQYMYNDYGRSYADIVWQMD